MKSKIDNLKISNILLNIKSNYILSTIFENINPKIYLEIIRYNKQLQNKLNKNINDYYYLFDKKEIKIELISKLKEKNIFINPFKDENYFHIYFDDSKEEIKRNYVTKSDKIKKIKVIIDSKIKSLFGLFQYCECVKKIEFKKFNNHDIDNMANMFFSCTSLKEIKFSKFNTDNVTLMSWMFQNCKSLSELKLSKFNTSNVTKMGFMFKDCSSLK